MHIIELGEGGVHAVINKDPALVAQIDNTHVHLGHPPIFVTGSCNSFALHNRRSFSVWGLKRGQSYDPGGYDVRLNDISLN
jgi:hypothetical protein